MSPHECGTLMNIHGTSACMLEMGVCPDHEHIDEADDWLRCSICWLPDNLSDGWTGFAGNVLSIRYP